MNHIVKLGTVATYVNGYAFKPSDWSDVGVPIIRIQDLTGNSYQMNRFSGEYDKKYEVQNGDVLIAWSASLGVYVWKSEKAVLNQHIFKVYFDKVDVDKDFFVYQMERLLQKASSQAHGATMRHLTKVVFDNLPFYLPDKETQIEIAKRLSTVTALIDLRKKELVKLDELVKSRFIEMFGDPKKNPNGWHKCFLRDVMKVPASNGFFAKPEDYTINGNAGIICVGDVVNRKYSNVKQLRRANADEKQFLKYKVKYGDILFCRSSLVKAGIAKASILPKQTPEDLLFECHVIRVQLDMNIIIPEYMQAFTETDYFRNQMIGKSKTATMTTIGQKDVISGEILLPPIELQKNFEKFTEQVDKSKIAIQKSLDELETLKKSLMQQYFG